MINYRRWLTHGRTGWVCHHGYKCNKIQMSGANAERIRSGCGVVTF